MKRFVILLMLLVLVAAPAIQVSAQALPGELGYVTDTCGLLTDWEREDLETRAKAISQQYAVGVYVLIVEDYTQYRGGPVLDTAGKLYGDHQLGLGTDRDGILLLLSMEDRDYALYVHGAKAQTAFNDRSLQKLEEAFLDDLGWDDWYGGLDDYLNTGKTHLSRAAEGKPVGKSLAGPIAVTCLICIAVAVIVCFVIKGTMNTARMQRQADAYITGAGLHLTGRYDRYTHSTEVRRKIQSSGGSHSSGGGSGRSGKF